MTIKHKRGAKLKCPNEKCGEHFYDLNRDPIQCPICRTAYSDAISISHVRAKPVKINSNKKTKDEDIKAGIKTDEDLVLELDDDDDSRKTLKTNSEVIERD